MEQVWSSSCPQKLIDPILPQEIANMADDIQFAYAGDIFKSERNPEGNLLVFGKATGSDMDLDEQYADPEWLKQAMPDWAKWGNLREMHQPIVAGIGRETTSDASGNWFLKSEVVDAGTAKKIEAGALKGYSIGIKNARVVKDAKAPGGRIVGGTIVEVSYVDRPCNPTSTIGIAKMVGAELAPVESDSPGTAWLNKKHAQNAVQDGDNNISSADDKVKPNKNDPCCPLCAGTGSFKPKQGKKHDGMKSADSAIESRLAELEKRFQKSGKNIDSSGRDVSSLDPGDFAGPQGTFPIKTRDDVSNAASLAHHAADPTAVKAKIRRIAKRKFQMEENELPKSVRKAKKNKDATPDLTKMVKKAVKSETAALVARAEAAEAKLADIEKQVVPGGPRPMGFPQSPEADAKSELAARLLKYKRLANEAQDASLAQGYEDLAKKVEVSLSKLA
jgi:hypothetical protein